MDPHTIGSGKNVKKTAIATVETPALAQNTGLVPEEGFDNPLGQQAEAGPSVRFQASLMIKFEEKSKLNQRFFAPQLEPARPMKTDIEDSDLQIKTEKRLRRCETWADRHDWREDCEVGVKTSRSSLRSPPGFLNGSKAILPTRRTQTDHHPS